MRWKQFETPIHFSRRDRKGFLIIPKKAFMHNYGYQWRWLEYAEWEDEYDGYSWKPSYWDKAKS